MEKILKCGCFGATRHAREHDGLEANHRSCIIHDTCETVDAPSFEGRRARCLYYGKSAHKSECDLCEKECSHEVDSSTQQAFFESKPDKEHDEFYCGCHSWN